MKRSFTKSALRGTALLLGATLVATTSCKKAESVAALKAQVASSTTEKAMDVNANADAAFAAYKNAFLVTSGTTQYFKESLSVSSKDYFWRQALDIQMVEDVYLRTQSSTESTLITNLLNTFLQQNQGSGGLTDWSWNQYNDDLEWAGLAFVRGYFATGNNAFLTQAEYAFNLAWNRGSVNPNVNNSGIWWDVPHTTMSGLSNNPEMILGCFIYQATHDQSYLTKVQGIYSWVKANLYVSTGANAGAVAENNTNGATSYSVYNIGAFVNAATYLHRLTGGTQMYYDDAKRSVDYVKANQTGFGILYNTQRQGTWQSEFIRGLSEFVRENNMWSTYYSWMKTNADYAWGKRNASNLIWNDWTNTTPSDNSLSAVECVGGVIMQEITPTSQPGFTENSVYRFTPKFATTKALDIAGSTSGSLADIWDQNNGSNQKFKIIPLATGSANSGYYRLVPQNNTATSLDVYGASANNNTPIDIWTGNTSSSQAFQVIDDYNGYYKLVPQCAPLSCVNVTAGNTANGTKCVLWPESFVDNERFSMLSQ